MLRRAYRVLRQWVRPEPAIEPQPQVVLVENAQTLEKIQGLEHKLDLILFRQIEFQREIRLMLSQAALPPTETWLGKPNGAGALVDGVVFPASTLCRQESFDAPYFTYWAAKINHAARYHRKVWEFVFICQVLHERGALGPGARGLGFGVGEESLPAFFASQGCLVTATDMAPEAATAAGWTDTQQHAASKEMLRRKWVCDDAVFDANVEFLPCDMNAIPDDMTGYSFCWSACALEHLGSIEHGLAFIERTLDCLQPGGFAVHTTEYNLSSNDDTVDNENTVLFRKRDLEELAERLKAKGHFMAPLDLNPGSGLIDRYIDVAPYRDEPHLKLALGGYGVTSVGLIIQKAR